MRVVLVAPGVQPPLTEGRKLFVTELAESLSGRGIRVDLVTGASRRKIAGPILGSLIELRTIARGLKSEDAVFVFPYGTFAGLRYYANRLLTLGASRICKSASVFFRPVFYSCSGLDLDQISARFGAALAVGRSGFGVEAIHLGTLRHLPRWAPSGNGLRRVLFLCGYQRDSVAELDKVLYERGLVDLLKAGGMLAEAGMELSVGIPFLRHPTMRERLRRLAAELCAPLRLEMYASESPIDLLASHDAFVFPYRVDHAVFVPTSVLEALQIGIPTLVADQSSYRALTTAGDVARCGLYRACDGQDLADQIRLMKSEYTAAVTRAGKTAKFVRDNWTMVRTVDELLSATG